MDAFAGGLILYNHGRARQVPDYRSVRRDFATAGQCLRHLQEEEGGTPRGVADGLPPLRRAAHPAAFTGALTPRPASTRLGSVVRSH